MLPIGSGFGSPYPYRWAVCHTGSWIRHEGRYVWVTGIKRHHHCPVHWVKSGRTVGYVPIHPGDVKGKPPLGLKDGVVHPVDKHGDKAQLVASGGPVKVLSEVPKEFRQPATVPLERAEAPRAQCHRPMPVLSQCFEQPPLRSALPKAKTI